MTEDGRRLAKATEQAFGILEEAVRALNQRARKMVRLVAGPIFTARWLMPRMSDFWTEHPDIELEVLLSFQPGELAYDNVDIVIRRDRLGEQRDKAVKLLELSPVAIVSGDFVADYGPVNEPGDLIDLPLMHQPNHWGWLDWFAAMNVPVTTALRGPIFEDANALLHGAAEGQGVVVGWLPLIDQDLAEGRVVRLFEEEIAPTQAYFLETRAFGASRREVRKVVEWLAKR